MKSNTFIAISIAFLFAACGTDDGSPVDSDINDALQGDSVDDTAGDDGLQADNATDLSTDAPTDAVQDAETTVPAAKVRFIHVSDIHFRAEPGQTERSDDGLASRVDLVNAIQGDFDMVVSTGDNYDHVLPEWDSDPAASPMKWFVEEMDKLRFPWIATIGNHEFYDFFGDIPTTTADGDKRKQTFSTVIGTPMYFVEEINGVKLIVLDAMENGTWGETHGLMGAFSDAQLDWLETQLSEGKPSFLFFHHPPTTLAPTGDQPSICDVMTRHPGVVKALFNGHLHSFWKGEFCNTKYFMVENFRNEKDMWFEVEYDKETDTVTLLNESNISFPVVPEFECVPGESTVTDPETAVGTIHSLIIENGTSDSAGLGEMLGEGLGNIPFVMSVDGYVDSDHFNTRLTIASKWDVDNFLTYVDGSACVPMELKYKGGVPCIEGGPVSLTAQLIPFLAAVGDEPVDPEWDAPLEIKNLTVEAKMGNDDQGRPIVSGGLIFATVVRDPTLAGLKKILVVEYCKGKADGCATPGADGLPTCPEQLDAAAVETVYQGITGKCDFMIQGFGVQMIIGMVESLPDQVNVTGELRSSLLTPSATPEEGGNVFSGLFDPSEGKNCSGTGVSKSMPRRSAL